MGSLLMLTINGAFNKLYFQLKDDNYDFFPLNRAMSLANNENDDSDTRMDGLVAKTQFIVKKIKHQVCTKSKG